VLNMTYRETPRIRYTRTSVSKLLEQEIYLQEVCEFFRQAER